METRHSVWDRVEASNSTTVGKRVVAGLHRVLGTHLESEAPGGMGT